MLLVCWFSCYFLKRDVCGACCGCALVWCVRGRYGGVQVGAVTDKFLFVMND